MSTHDALVRARRAFGRRAPRLLAPLLEQPLGAALAFDLEALRVPSGRWADLSAAAPGRLLDLPLVALHDLGYPEGARREALEAALLDAGALSVAAIFLAEATLGAEAGHAPASALLLGPLVAAATARLAAGAADPARAGTRLAAAWAIHADALELAGRFQPDWVREGDALTPGVLAALGRRHAPLSVLCVHALEAGGRPEPAPVLAAAFEQVAGLHQLICDLDAVHRDLARGWWSLPVARLAAAAGALPADEGPPPVSAVLFAALITRAVPSLAREALQQVEAVTATFAAAGLDGVRACAASLAAPLEAVVRRHDPAPRAPVGAPAPVAFRIDPRPRAEQAVIALRAALDDDPDSREAWFTRRSGRPGEIPAVDRLSGPATILENRVRAGERRPADVDALISALGEARGRLEVDALATLARLAPAAGDPEAACRRLRAPLALALAGRPLAGGLPAWVDGRTGGIIDARGPLCAGVQARLALGLLAWPEPPAEALSLAGEGLAQVAAAGAEAFAVHDPLHGALLVLELVETLRGYPAPAAPAAEGWALGFAARWQGRAATSPLAAAWLWLISGLPSARALREPHWRVLLLRGQRSAGTWDGHPCLREPAPGPARPASRLVTTSFVYRALVDEEPLRYGLGP